MSTVKFAVNWPVLISIFPQAYVLKFIYSEKATKFCEIFTLLLTVCTVVKSKVKIFQNFVAYSEYIYFNWLIYLPEKATRGADIKRETSV